MDTDILLYIHFHFCRRHLRNFGNGYGTMNEYNVKKRNYIAKNFRCYYKKKERQA